MRGANPVMNSFTFFDYIYIAVVLGSTLWAFARGGVYEMVATISWLVAAFASNFISPALNEVLQKTFGWSEPATLVTAYFAVFFGVLVLFGLFNQRLRDWIHSSVLQITDRALGIIFGILRAMIVMGLAYWAALGYFHNDKDRISSADKLPPYIRNAKTRPIMQLTAATLSELFWPSKSETLGRDMAASKQSSGDIYRNAIDPVIKAAGNAESSFGPNEGETHESGSDGVGYKESERDELDRQLMQLENLPNLDK